MQSALWKIAALLSVIGVGTFVVFEVHKRLPAPATSSDGSRAEQFTSLGDPASAPSDPADNGSPSPRSQDEAFELFAPGTVSSGERPDALVTASAAGAGPSIAVRDFAPPQSDEPEFDDRASHPFAASSSAAIRPSPSTSWGEPGAASLADSSPEDEGSNPFEFARGSRLASPPGLPAQRPLGLGSAADEPAPALPAAAPDGAPPIRTAAALTDDIADVDVTPVASGPASDDEFTHDPFAAAAIDPAVAEANLPEPFAAFGPQPLPMGDGPPRAKAFPSTDDEETAEERRLPPLRAVPLQMPAFPTEADQSAEGDAPPSAALPDPFTLGEQRTSGAAPATAGQHGRSASPPTAPALEQPAADDVSETPLEEGPAGTPSASPLRPAEPDLPLRPTPVPGLEEHLRGAPQPEQHQPGIRIIPNPVAGGAPPAELVGDATLDAGAPSGAQQPELTIQKIAPAESTVGEPLVYAIKVRNVGQSAAHDVIVEDRIPRGTTLEGSIPQAELVDKRLIWQLGQMPPGEEKTIRIKVVPTEPGEIGSVATVRFVAEVAATTRITTPDLTLDVSGPQEVTLGEQTVFHFRIANVGQGEARNVYIRNLLPAGLEHPGGHDIEYDVGALRPGETREVDLPLTAAQEGMQQVQAFLNTGSTTRAQVQGSVNVIRSRLLIQRQGPRRRFIGRPADYTTTVTNRSSAPLQRISVVEQLPQGLELAAVPQAGHFDPQRRTITWRIDSLAPGASTSFLTSVIGREQGAWQGTVRAADAAGNRAELTSKLEVAGFASLTVDLEHDGRPVGIGEQVALRLTVRNRGTSAAEAVQAQFEIPEHLEFVNARGPVEFEQEGRTIRFAALEQLPAEGEQSFDIVLTAAAAGTMRVSAQLSTSDLETPLRYDEAVVVEPDGQ